MPKEELKAIREAVNNAAGKIEEQAMVNVKTLQDFVKEGQSLLAKLTKFLDTEVPIVVEVRKQSPYVVQCWADCSRQRRDSVDR